FFFQAEDGIRDRTVTGVQTCALPIWDLERAAGRLSQASGNARDLVALKTSLQQIPELKRELRRLIERTEFGKDPVDSPEGNPYRSEERRVGKESRSRRLACPERERRA